MAVVSKPGLYRGTVIADNRPVGKLTIQVPGALGTAVVNAISARIMVGYDQVAASVTWIEYGLDAKTAVWVMFEQGDPSHPVVIGLL